MADRAYEDAHCPMPGCGAPLYITWTLSRPVFTADTAADLRDPAGAYSGGWEVSCEEGHVVLLPRNPPGAARDVEEFGADLDEDLAPDQHDLARLHALLRHDLWLVEAERRAHPPRVIEPPSEPLCICPAGLIGYVAGCPRHDVPSLLKG